MSALAQHVAGHDDVLGNTAADGGAHVVVAVELLTMAVRTTRVSEPVLGTAMASAGRKIWLRYVPGSAEGNPTRIPAREGPRSARNVGEPLDEQQGAQKDGVARHAMEMTRMTWSRHLSR